MIEALSYLERIEEINFECLELYSYSIFINDFLFRLTIGDEDDNFKLYMNTLKKINLNINSSDFYRMYVVPDLSFSKVKDILQAFTSKFAKLQDLKVDFI